MLIVQMLVMEAKYYGPEHLAGAQGEEGSPESVVSRMSGPLPDNTGQHNGHMPNPRIENIIL